MLKSVCAIVDNNIPALTEWIGGLNLPSRLGGGKGGAVWLEKGQVVDVWSFGQSMNADELLRRTLDIWSK
jgi:hypothetical protein